VLSYHSTLPTQQGYGSGWFMTHLVGFYYTLLDDRLRELWTRILLICCLHVLTALCAWIYIEHQPASIGYVVSVIAVLYLLFYAYRSYVMWVHRARRMKKLGNKYSNAPEAASRRASSTIKRNVKVRLADLNRYDSESSSSEEEGEGDGLGLGGETEIAARESDVRIITRVELPFVHRQLPNQLANPYAEARLAAMEEREKRREEQALRDAAVEIQNTPAGVKPSGKYQASSKKTSDSALVFSSSIKKSGSGGSSPSHKTPQSNKKIDASRRMSTIPSWTLSSTKEEQSARSAFGSGGGDSSEKKNVPFMSIDLGDLSGSSSDDDSQGSSLGENELRMTTIVSASAPSSPDGFQTTFKGGDTQLFPSTPRV
jgi:hypothetical protein